MRVTAVFTCLVAACVLCVSPSHALRNGMGLTPPLGWSTWCGLGPCGNDYCSEAYVMQAATAMQSNGMQARGYNWVLLDDCWAATARTEAGQITWDTDRFPHGFLWSTAPRPQLQFWAVHKLRECDVQLRGRPLPIPGSEHHYQEDVIRLRHGRWTT